LVVTIFSLIEIALALLGLYILFGLDEIRLAGRRVRGQAMAYIGVLLFTPLPFAVMIGSFSGAAQHLAKPSAGKSWDQVNDQAVEELGWLDPAGIAVSASLIALVFLVFGKPDDRTPDSQESLARDGWQDPPDWRRRAAELSSKPLPVDQPNPAEQPPASAAETPAKVDNYPPS
jgi:hypothetical protein